MSPSMKTFVALVVVLAGLAAVCTGRRIVSDYNVEAARERRAERAKDLTWIVLARHDFPVAAPDVPGRPPQPDFAVGDLPVFVDRGVRDELGALVGLREVGRHVFESAGGPTPLSDPEGRTVRCDCDGKFEKGRRRVAVDVEENGGAREIRVTWDEQPERDGAARTQRRVRVSVRADDR